MFVSEIKRILVSARVRACVRASERASERAREGVCGVPMFATRIFFFVAPPPPPTLLKQLCPSEVDCDLTASPTNSRRRASRCDKSEVPGAPKSLGWSCATSTRTMTDPPPSPSWPKGHCTQVTAPKWTPHSQGPGPPELSLYPKKIFNNFCEFLLLRFTSFLLSLPDFTQFYVVWC